MTLLARMKKVTPYVALLIGGFVLYGVAGRIDYTPIPDQIGPEVWPKIILILMIVVCLFCIVRHLVMPPPPVVADLSAQLVLPEDASPEHEEDHPALVLAVVAATCVYLLLLETAGFFLCTLVFTVCLMLCGGVRRPALIAGLALLITTFFTFTFMKIVYVALPIGVEPFSSVSLGVMKLLGIH